MDPKSETRREREARLYRERQAAKPVVKPKPLRRAQREKYASREEQNARYIDCGPQAWDDRDGGDR